MYDSMPWCEDYLNGALNKGMVQAIKSMKIWIDDWLLLWKDRRATRAGINSVLNRAAALDFMGGFNKVMAKYYYSIIVPATDSLFGQLADHLTILEGIANFIYV